MSKKYDFSAFDKPAPAGNKYDFSAFDKAPESEETSFLDKARTFAENAPLGFADEIGALAGAAGAKVGGDEQAFWDIYNSIKPEIEAEQNKRSEANPVSALLGNLTGGVAVGSALGAGGVLAKGASMGAKMAQGAAAGAELGAIQGLGESDASLVNGEFGDAAKDVVKGSVFGGATGLAGGAAAHGIGKTAKMVGSGVASVASPIIKGTKYVAEKISDMPGAKTLKEAWKFGTEGVNLVGDKAQRELGDALYAIPDKLVSTLKELDTKFGKLKGSIIDQGERKGYIVDLENAYKKALEEAEKLPTEFPEQITRKEKVIEYLNSRLKGVQKEFKITDIKYGEPVVVAAKPGMRAKLEQEAELAVIDAKNQGVNLKTQIIEGVDSKGNKTLTLQKIIDEPIDAGEKVVQKLTPGEVSEAAENVTKVKKEFKEISPKNRDEAKYLKEKLERKAATEGKDNTYRIVEDKASGTIQVIEDGTKVKTVRGEPVLGEPELVSSPEGNYKTKMQSKTVYDEPSIGEHSEFPRPLEAVETTVPYTETPQLKMGVKTADQVKMATQDKVVYDDAGNKVNKVNRVYEGLGHNIKEAVEAPFEQKNPFGQIINPLKETNEKIHLIKSMLDDDLPNLGNLQNLENQTNSNVKARNIVDSFLKKVEQVDPALAKQWAKELPEAASRYDLAKFINTKTQFGGGNFVSGLIGAGTRAGATIGNLAGQAWAQGAKKIGTASPQMLQGLSSQVKTIGPKGADLARVIDKMVDKDQKGRNALIFAISQNPEYRKMLENVSPDFWNNEIDKK